MPLLLNDIRNVFSYKSHSQAELRVKASDTERERLAIVLAETNFNSWTAVEIDNFWEMGKHCQRKIPVIRYVSFCSSGYKGKESRRQKRNVSGGILRIVF